MLSLVISATRSLLCRLDCIAAAASAEVSERNHSRHDRMTPEWGHSRRSAGLGSRLKSGPTGQFTRLGTTATSRASGLEPWLSLERRQDAGERSI